MTQTGRPIISFGVPVAQVMAFLILLYSSPLHSNTSAHNVPTVSFAHGKFVPLDAFAKTSGSTLTLTSENHKITLRKSNRQVVFTRQSSVVKIGQEIYRMPTALWSHNGHLYMPQETALLIAQSLNTTISFFAAKSPSIASKAYPPPRNEDSFATSDAAKRLGPKCGQLEAQHRHHRPWARWQRPRRHWTRWHI